MKVLSKVNKNGRSQAISLNKPLLNEAGQELW